MTISKTNSGCSYEKQSSIARPKQSRQVQKILSWRKEKMNDKITCEKCGSEMRPIDSNKPVGMICPKCGWGWATSYMDPMRDDDTTYTISLSEGNSVTNATIQTIAKISNKNYLQAKKIIENSPMNIYIGKATQIKDILYCFFLNLI